jgi:hypothetical protein
MTPDVEAKITKLLALATDEAATEEEKRTAAKTAAELMKKHGFTPKQTSAQPARQWAPPAAKPMNWDTFFEEQRRKQIVDLASFALKLIVHLAR